jgi:hypothetical protein
MSSPVKPATLGSELNDILRRLRQLETYHTPATVPLAYSTLALGSGTATTTAQVIPSSSLSFTAPVSSSGVPILVISSVCITTNGASGANWVNAYLTCTYGQESSEVTLLAVTGTSTVGIANTTRFLYIASCPQGTYTTNWQVHTNAGTASFGTTGNGGETLVLQLDS